jgi:acetate kinase
MHILVLNAGSSTLKFRLFAMADAEETVRAEGIVDRVGSALAELRLSVAGQPAMTRPVPAETPGQAAEQVLTSLIAPESGAAYLPFQIDVVAHRVVHGGARFVEPTRLTPDALDSLRALSELAPLHNPVNIAGIETGLRLLPDAPAIAVFDTAFHHTLPAVAANYALPLEYATQHGLRRYGFHGISHQYVSARLLECLGRGVEGTRVITCHLGNGASVCAVQEGKSVDTSMGLTPLEGLLMGTRSGDLDPGLVLHLLRVQRMTVEAVDDLLNHRSGLKGLSGSTGDVRDLEQAASAGNTRAELALECFAYRVRKYIGAYAAALGGVEAVAFTGGIGEHSVLMRRRICRGLEFLGLRLDAEQNARVGGREPARISSDDSPAQLWVIPTDEERQIAREAYALLHV